MDVELKTRVSEVVHITGNSLRALRENKGYSQGKLAELLTERSGLGISAVTIHRWEKSFEFDVDREMLDCILKTFFKI